MINRVNILDNEIFFKYEVDDAFFCGITKKGVNSFSYHTITTEEEKEFVKNSRDLLLQKTGFNSLITLKQTHSDIIHMINDENLFQYNSNPYNVGDGLITGIKGVLIGVSTADCVPVMYFSDNKNICGIVHAGWRGIYSKIHLKIIDKMGVDPQNLRVIIGPHIRQCCYKVGEEMYNYFDETNFKEKNSQLFLSLENVVINDLISYGIKRENIYSLKLCSFCNNDLFYSYRRGEEKGRNLSFIGIF